MNFKDFAKKYGFTYSDDIKKPEKLPLHELGDSSIQQIEDLCGLIKGGLSPVFEFGTFIGKSTYRFALNSKHKVYTFDLGSGKVKDPHKTKEESYRDTYISGECYKGKQAEKNIVSLIGDSFEYDFSKLHNKFKMVIIDGGHSYKVCRCDSENALKMVKKGGIIVWDDYNNYWPGVMKAVDSLGIETIGISGGRVVHIKDGKPKKTSK